MNDSYFLQKAVDEGRRGMNRNDGGPFGALIVKDSKIVAKAHNMVTSANDPTAHAEIVAIRKACKKLKSFSLEGAVLYASTEPCPMCLAAIYWAGIKKVCYATTKKDAANINFSDKFIYDEFARPPEKRKVKLNQIKLPSAKELFAEWKDKADKIHY